MLYRFWTDPPCLLSTASGPYQALLPHFLESLWLIPSETPRVLFLTFLLLFSQALPLCLPDWINIPFSTWNPFFLKFLLASFHHYPFQFQPRQWLLQEAAPGLRLDWGPWAPTALASASIAFIILGRRCLLTLLSPSSDCTILWGQEL